MVNYEGWDEVLDGNGIVNESTASRYAVVNSDETITIYISSAENISYDGLGQVNGGTITEVRRMDSNGNLLISATVSNIPLTAIVPDILTIDLFDFINQAAPIDWEFDLVEPGDNYEPVTTTTSIILDNANGGTTVITGVNFDLENGTNGSVDKIEQFDPNGILVSSLTNIGGLPLLNIAAALLPSIASELAAQVMFYGNDTFTVHQDGHNISGAEGDDTITGEMKTMHSLVKVGMIPLSAGMVMTF